jgi:hypothetical protein
MVCHPDLVIAEGSKKDPANEVFPPMSVWTFTLMAVVTLIWVGMFGAVAYLAAQKAHKVPTPR